MGHASPVNMHNANFLIRWCFRISVHSCFNVAGRTSSNFIVWFLSNVKKPRVLSTRVIRNWAEYSSRDTGCNHKNCFLHESQVLTGAASQSFRIYKYNRGGASADIGTFDHWSLVRRRYLHFGVKTEIHWRDYLHADRPSLGLQFWPHAFNVSRFWRF